MQTEGCQIFYLWRKAGNADVYVLGFICEQILQRYKVQSGKTHLQEVESVTSALQGWASLWETPGQWRPRHCLQRRQLGRQKWWSRQRRWEWVQEEDRNAVCGERRRMLLSCQFPTLSCVYVFPPYQLCLLGKSQKSHCQKSYCDLPCLATIAQSCHTLRELEAPCSDHRKGRSFLGLAVGEACMLWPAWGWGEGEEETRRTRSEHGQLVFEGPQPEAISFGLSRDLIPGLDSENAKDSKCYWFPGENEE